MGIQGYHRYSIRFYGRVQGVGFRFTAKYAATSLALTGWVKNLDDGSVLMEIQGSPLRIDKLLMKLNRDNYIRIDHIARTRIDPIEGEKSFRVADYW